MSQVANWDGCAYINVTKDPAQRIHGPNINGIGYVSVCVCVCTSVCMVVCMCVGVSVSMYVLWLYAYGHVFVCYLCVDESKKGMNEEIMCATASEC